MRNVWNGEYHSRSQCVCGTIATVIGCVSGMPTMYFRTRDRRDRNDSAFGRQAVHTTGAIPKSDGLTFLAVRSASPGHLGGVLILEGALKKFLRRGSLVAILAGTVVAVVTGVLPSGRTSNRSMTARWFRCHTDTGDQPQHVVGRHRRGARRVHAGRLRARGDRLQRKKHAAHVMSTNFAIFGLGFVGFFFIGFPLAFGGFSYARSSGWTHPSAMP